MRFATTIAAKARRWIVARQNGRATRRTLARLRSRAVVMPDGTMEYVEAGRGTPVLVLHGGVGGWDQAVLLGLSLFGPDGSPGSYREVLGDEPRQLEGVRLIAPSRPGYLGTPLDCGRSPAAAADACARLLDGLGIESCVVAGVSGGGPTALQMAIRHPGRVRGLLLAAAITRRHVQPRRTTDGVVGWIVFSPLSGAALDLVQWVFLGVARALPRIVVEQLLRATETTGRSAGDVARRREWMAWLLCVLRTSFPLSARRAEVSNDLATYAGMEERPDYAAIRCPTLIVHGREDGNVGLDQAEWVGTCVPGARLEVIEGSGHFLWMSEGEARARRLAREFVAGCG